MIVRVSRPRSTRHFSGLFFAPAGHRPNVFVKRRAPADLSIACLLSCLRSMSHVAAMLQAVQARMFTGLRTLGCFSAPEAVLSEVEQRFDCVQAQIHLLYEFGGEFSTLILNRISLLQVRGQTHSTDRKNKKVILE